MSGLADNTTFYVRAYATNSAGTGYGATLSFTTLPSCTLPTVTTASISAILATSATGGGNVTATGGCAVTARGVCWSTSTNPTISNSHTTDGSGTGSFVSNMTGLTCGTTYYARSYATNSAGTSYGSQVSFTTTSVNLPSFNVIIAVNTSNCGNVTITSESTASTACYNLHNCTITGIPGQSYRASSVEIGQQVWGFSNCVKAASAWHIYAAAGVSYILHLDSNGVIDIKYQCHP